MGRKKIPIPTPAARGDGWVGKDGNGFRTFFYVNGTLIKPRFKTYAEAEAHRIALCKDRDAGINIGTAQQTVAQWIEHWLQYGCDDLKAKTREGYRAAVDRYILPQLGHIRLKDLKAQHIEVWQKNLRTKGRKTARGDAPQGLAVNTVLIARRRLDTALEYARRHKVIAENPARSTKAPRNDDKVPVQFLTPEEIRTFLGSIRQHRLYALYAVEATYGLRRGEILGLQWANVDIDGPKPCIEVKEQMQELHRDGAIVFVYGTVKTKGGKRRLVLNAELVALLRQHRTQQREERLALGQWNGGDLVFTSEAGTPLRARNILRQFHRMLHRANLRQVTFHSLRHSAGSIMLAYGVSLVTVSKTLGHSSVDITAGIYAHLLDIQREHAAESMRFLLENVGT